MYNITVIPGDGIGIEVSNAALDVLNSLNIDFKFHKALAGYKCFQDTGTTIPQETIELSLNADATLFGAVTTVPGQKSAIITLRKELDLFANVRPIKSYEGINSLYNNVDMVIIRENSEGLYSGVEEYNEEGATALRVITRKACKRISKFAFDYSRKNNRNKITAVHKSNVLKKTDGIFKETFYNIAKEYPDIEVEDKYVDATAMLMITKPHDFDVIVTTNLFGDILSDEGSGLVGGLGLAPSANIGESNALFEPVHGSAPDIAGRNISNPLAMLLSVVMMLDYLGENYEARRLENVIINLLREGKILTPDLGGSNSTMEIASEIKSRLE
ncbi:MAG: homoisocitrate dehydrogenase [Methanobacteriaceae archaeon]|nr:homoisocitrate dehydrogenase [Methanobacteriaceae archaeon]